jgi:two-component system KDP operon response regulator KdpE
VRLTPKEFELLRYLTAHPNKVLSHRELLQAAWGPDYDDQVDYRRVFVNQLRKKIEQNPSSPRYLLTEPWVGYRLQVETEPSRRPVVTRGIAGSPSLRRPSGRSARPIAKIEAEYVRFTRRKS